MSDLFCRHNRFTADCPICAKGTLLDPERTTAKPRARTQRPPRAGRAGGKRPAPAGAQFHGPYARVGPYERDGDAVEVRLEKVPGGVRLAEWVRGSLQRRAPVLPAGDIRALVAQARECQLLPERDLQALEAAAGAAPAAGDPHPWGASRGRAGDLQEELRVEAVGEQGVRVARWVLRPGAGWELQDAPPMLPAARFAEALAAAVRAGAV